MYKNTILKIFIVNQLDKALFFALKLKHYFILYHGSMVIKLNFVTKHE